MSTEMKKLTRSQDDRIVAGVAAGLAEYLKVDATIVRLLFALSAFVGGGGFFVYVLMMLIVPEAPKAGSAVRTAEPVEAEVVEVANEE